MPYRFGGVNCVEPREQPMDLCFGVPFWGRSVMADRGRRSEHQRQHREYERLDEADEQFQPEERDDSDQWDKEDHSHQQNFSGEYVSE